MVGVINRIVLLFLVSCLSTKVAATQLTIEQAQSLIRLPNEPIQQGSFTQNKQLKILKKPFISSGEFKVSGSSFTWTTLKPIRNVLLFDGEKLWQFSQRGDEQEIPTSAHYIKVIKALVVGDLKQLSKHFIFKKATVDDCLLLAPKTKQLAVIADSIGLCTGTDSLTVTLNEARGNVTEIVINRQAINQESKG